MNRPETIEETAELVDAAGGRGHRRRRSTISCPTRCARSSTGSSASRARLHVLVNDIWGATQDGVGQDRSGSPTWTYGLRTLRLAVDTHAITSHFAIPLLHQERPAAWSSR